VTPPDSRPPPPETEPQAERDSSARLTLPPPELGARKHGRSDRPVPALPRAHPRPAGAFAEEARLRARLEDARRDLDPERERASSIRLARWLATCERDLDQAVTLARRALSAKDDPELRRELATWLEGLGDAAHASEVMAPLASEPEAPPAPDGAPPASDPRGASVFLRIGVLSARAAEAGAAADAFAQAARLDPSDALPCELRGSLHAWAPEVLSAEQAADAYLEAARRREAAGALDAQLENVWRAHDCDPRREEVVTAIAAALALRGRESAADEAVRMYAGLLAADSRERALGVLARRRIEAIANDELPRALAAALDEGLDAEVDGSAGDALDDLLARAGLVEPLAARLELRAERAVGLDRARVLEELGRLLAGPLASPERAVEAFAAAMAVDPTRTEALVALRAHAAQRRDPGPLVDALVNVLATEGGEAPREWEGERARGARIACARTLLHVAEEQLADPLLAAWAAERLLRLEPDDAQGRASLARAQTRRVPANERFDAARAALAADDERGGQKSGGKVRIELLRAVAAAARGIPAESALRARVLAELAARLPGDRAVLAEAYRAAWSRGDREQVRGIAQEELSAGDEAWQIVEARRQLAMEARWRGAWAEAGAATVPLLDDAADHRLSAGIAWAHAALGGDRKGRARALFALAANAAPRVRTMLYGVAASALLEVGDPVAARRAADFAAAAGPTDAGGTRGIVVRAEAAEDEGDDRVAAAAYERAIGVMGPRASWCAKLADRLERAGEANYAVSWTQRLVALRPGDPSVIEVLVKRAVRARDPARLADAIGWALSQPQPAGSLAGHVASALRELAAIDSARASTTARRALDVFGPRHDALRAAMAAVGESARDDALSAAIVERWIAIGAPTADRGSLHGELVKLRQRMGDRDGEARAIERAVRDGFDVRGFEANLDALASARLAPDGEIAFLESRSALASAKGDAAMAGATLRQLGASLWELAQDRGGAARAFLRATTITGDVAALGVDLARFNAPSFALEILGERLAKEKIPERAAALAAEAARAALAAGEPARAFDLAVSALVGNPSVQGALEVAERGSAATGRQAEMSPLYDSVGQHALGRFGRRAAHYRAARFFEQRGEPSLALKHAAEAFVAVPSEGTTFVLLARTAERAGDRAGAVRAIEGVAQTARSGARRAAWLLRAASLVASDEEGLRQRVDVLLRAAFAAPDLGTIALLADAARELLSALPEEREGLVLRFGRAAHKVAEALEGPDGARAAVSLATVLLEVFDDPEGGGDLVLRALAMDADIDEIGGLLRFAGSLGGSEGAAALLTRAFELCDKPYANVGAPAWGLLAAIAQVAGNQALEARARVSAAARDPEDDALVRAADAALRGSDDPSLPERLAKKVTLARRLEVLLKHARERATEGATSAAIDGFERALEVLDAAIERGQAGASAGEREALEHELRDVCEAAGSIDRLEERALRAASDARLSATERSARWTEIATERERRGDPRGAASAFFEAAVLEPTSIERWSALERVAAEAGRHDLRTHALEEIGARVPRASRASVLRRLARAHEEAGDGRAAESTWHEVWTEDPEDEEADQAIEAQVVARADYVALAEHLGRRAERLSVQSGAREALRAVRLRRAVILEQRLNRPHEAAEELALLLTECPDSENALSYLADLYERLGASDRAAPLWRRVAAIAKDPSRQMEMELRASAASRAAGDLPAALEHVRRVTAQEPRHREAAALRVEIARALHDDAELGEALDQLALIADDVAARSELLVEAAQAAARANDVGKAVTRAQRAARLSPASGAAQLYARGLEYRVRGAGSPDDARATIEELGKIAGQLPPDDASLQSFLLAEAFDAVQGGGAGLHRLMAAERQIGAHPVLSLGLGERLVAQWKFGEAVTHFKRALTADLLGLRKRGSVALAGADAALRVEDHESALAFLDVAAGEPESRTTALRKLAAIVTSRGDVKRSRAVLLELARAAGPEDRARTLAQLARLLLASGTADERAEAIRILDEAVASAPPEGVLRAQLENEAETLRSRSSIFPRAAVPPRVEPAPEPPPIDLPALERAAAEATTPGDRGRAQVALARGHLAGEAYAAAETVLWEALDEGSAEAGELLASVVERDSSRTAERLKVRRKLVELFPGHIGRLESLRAAALADRNSTHARAIEHVLRAFDPGAGPLPPPALAGQREQPGMLAHLTRPSLEARLEPLSIAWDASHSLFTKTPIAYAVTGVERVTPGTTSPLARLYDATLRLLGVPRLPLFYRRSNEPLKASVAMTYPASALVIGEAREDNNELRHALGMALAGALPGHVLLVGVPEAQARTVWQALLVAFGPPGAARGLGREESKLAEQFWSTLPPRSQRKLQELLVSAAVPDLDVLLAAARQSARRLALFVSGDFGYAVRSYLQEQKIEPSAVDAGLQVLCAEHAPLSDLLRLAVSSEYADARWLPVAPSPQRSPASSSSRGRALL
jgi:hypothetical protein